MLQSALDLSQRPLGLLSKKPGDVSVKDLVAGESEGNVQIAVFDHLILD